MAELNKYQNRIIGSGEEQLDQIMFNPRNWRIHPMNQQNALKGVLEEVGWVQQVIVNKQTGNLIDGHLRCQLAAREGNTTIPVVYVDVSPDEEALILSTLDPIAGMATTDKEKLDDLFRQFNSDNENVQKLIASISDREGLESIVNNRGDDAHKTLAERFIVPPFSVLDARQGYWQDRKRVWIALGIQSELGRGYTTELTASIKSQGRQSALQNGKASTSSTTALSDWAGGFSARHETGTSIFDPVLCELAYRWFCVSNGKVLDPFAGGSVRGIVASVLGFDYTGIDLSETQVQANKEQAIKITPDKHPKWIVGDSKNIKDLAPDEYDFILSCPPYANLEVYSDNPNDLSTMDYKDFISAYREIIANSVSMLRDNRFACFCVGDIRDKKGYYRNFVSNTIDAFQDAGMMLYNEGIFITPAGTLPIRVSASFQKNRKLGKTHQNVLIFYKGDPKAIRDFGDVECGDIDATGGTPELLTD